MSWEDLDARNRHPSDQHEWNSVDTFLTVTGVITTITLLVCLLIDQGVLVV